MNDSIILEGGIKTVIKKINYYVKLCSAVAITVCVAFTPKLLADVIDDKLSETHNYISYYENPHTDRGTIVGIDGYGDEYALVWANGAVARYDEDDSLIGVFGTGNSDATAIAYVTSGAGISGNIAVARPSGFLTYDFSGNEIQGYSIFSSYDVKDIDIELGKVWVGQTGNFGYRDPDTYSVHEMLSGDVDAVMGVNLIDEEIDRMHVGGGAGSFVKKFNPDLTFMPDTISTDYISHEGFALTDNYLFLVVDDYVVKYDNPYQGYMEPVPEPATLVMLGLGVGLGTARRRRSL